MPFEVPDVSGKIKLDLAPMEEGFDRAKAEAARFAADVAESKVALGPVALDFSGAKDQAGRLAAVLSETVGGVAIAPPMLDVAGVKDQAATMAATVSSALSGISVQPPQLDVSRAKAEADELAASVSAALADVAIQPPQLDLSQAKAEAAGLAATVSEAMAGVTLRPPQLDLSQAEAQAAALAATEAEALAGAKFPPPHLDLTEPKAQIFRFASEMSAAVAAVKLKPTLDLSQAKAQVQQLAADIKAAGNVKLNLPKPEVPRVDFPKVTEAPKLDTAAAAKALAVKPAAAEAAGVESAKNFSNGFLTSLNEEVGKRSTFGKIAKLAAGGGVVGGLAVAANVIDQLTVAAEKFALALDKGGDAARTGAAELLKAIPIVGKLGEAGERIWGIVSGEAAYVARIKEATEAQERHMAVVQALHAEVDSFTKGAADRIASLDAKLAGGGLGGLRKELFDIGHEAGEQFKAVREAADAAFKSEAFGNAQKDITAATQKLRELQQQLASAPQTVITSFGGAVGQPQFAPNPAIPDLQSRVQQQQAAVERAKKGLDDQVKNINKGVAAQLGKIGEVDVKQRIGAVVADWFKSLPAAAGAAGAGITEQMKRAEDAITAAQRDLASFGLTPEQLRLFDFNVSLGALPEAAAAFAKMSDDERQLVDVQDMLGIPPDMITKYEQLIGQIERAKDAQKMGDEVDHWRDSLKGPLDRYQEMIDKLEEWREKGLIGIDEFRQGMEKVKGDVEKSTPEARLRDQPARFAPAIRAGTNEALKLSFQLQQARPEQQLSQKQLTEQQKTNRLLDQIHDDLDFEVA